MSWTWDYRAAPVGDSLEILTDYCLEVRVLAEWSTGRRGDNLVGQYTHGEIVVPDKFVKGANMVLETIVRYTNSAGAVTHGDGEAGHVMENLGSLKRIFGGKQTALTRLQRIAPHQGTVTIDVEMLGSDALPSQARHIFAWPLHAPKPYWTGAADNGNNGTTLTPGGDAPIDDMVIHLTGGTNAQLTHDDTGKFVKVVGTPGGTTDIDVGARTADNGGDVLNLVRVNSPDWFQLDAGANAVTLTGGGSYTCDWNTKYR